MPQGRESEKGGEGGKDATGHCKEAIEQSETGQYNEQLLQVISDISDATWGRQRASNCPSHCSNGDDKKKNSSNSNSNKIYSRKAKGKNET